MIDIEKLMKSCQIGTYSIDMANDLLADCYGTLGKQQARIAELEAEVERQQEDWGICPDCGRCGDAERSKKFDVCPSCKGEKGHYDATSMKGVWHVCHICHGTGRVRDE